MRINKQQLENMLSLPDDKLWAEIRRLAGGYGLNLPSQTPKHEEIEKIRSAAGGGKINMGEAMRLINIYRKDSNL